MEGYTDYVRNVIMNYCAHTSQDLTFRYIFTRAKFQASQHDHEYLALIFSECQIDYAFDVSEERAKEIEKLRAAKRTTSDGFWSGRFGEISRITPRRQIRNLCESIACPKVLNSPAVQQGKLYEQKAIKQLEKRFHIKTQKCGLFVPIDRPCLGASLNAIVGNDGIIEVKCPYAGRNMSILPGPKLRCLQLDSLLKTC